MTREIDSLIGDNLPFAAKYEYNYHYPIYPNHPHGHWEPIKVILESYLGQLCSHLIASNLPFDKHMESTHSKASEMNVLTLTNLATTISHFLQQ